LGGSNTGFAVFPDTGAENRGAGASAEVHAGGFRLLSMAFMERDMRGSNNSAERRVLPCKDVGDGANAAAVARRDKTRKRVMVDGELI
jgi:hypothetical protein